MKCYKLKCRYRVYQENETIFDQSKHTTHKRKVNLTELIMHVLKYIT